MKKNLEIQDFEAKVKKDGVPYTRFKTNEGWMSCFDSVACDALKQLHKKVASVEVVEKDNFKNIRSESSLRIRLQHCLRIM